MSGPPPHATNASITVDEYHKLADSSLEAMLDAFEWMAESDETVQDVEYSNHVLTLSVPKGVYVFNKQPPTMQLWLSSPVSGPKRYDWDADKETWVYLRDGTLLEDLLTEELGVEVDFADLD
ncbi:Frataxin [Ascodesmis nigricans]|uniref:ferroxidase n=1 Tax=Ascodesmis nigricans TaxID=341454 RepID=A0A4S2N674_9PEZI|nr:Frataxin [Ascodesmis nigricans]